MGLQASTKERTAMITIQQELASEGWDEFLPLVVDHCKEIGQEAPDLNQEVLLMLEESGQLRCYTVRDEGVAVGYAIYLLEMNVMQQTRLIAKDVGLFLEKSHRGGITAVRLLKFAEVSMMGEGVAEVFQSIPADSPVGDLLLRLGYHRIEEVYTKTLEGGTEELTRLARTR